MAVGVGEPVWRPVRHWSQGDELISGAGDGGAGGGGGGRADPGGPLEGGTGARHNLRIDVLDVLRGLEFSKSQSINLTSQHQSCKITGPSGGLNTPFPL